MDFLEADRGQGGDHHIEAVEPGPGFAVVIARRTGDDDE